MSVAFSKPVSASMDQMMMNQGSAKDMDMEEEAHKKMSPELDLAWKKHHQAIAKAQAIYDQTVNDAKNELTKAKTATEKKTAKIKYQQIVKKAQKELDTAKRSAETAWKKVLKKKKK